MHNMHVLRETLRVTCNNWVTVTFYFCAKIQYYCYLIGQNSRGRVAAAAKFDGAGAKLKSLFWFCENRFTLNKHSWANNQTLRFCYQGTSRSQAWLTATATQTLLAATQPLLTATPALLAWLHIPRPRHGSLLPRRCSLLSKRRSLLSTQALLATTQVLLLYYSSLIATATPTKAKLAIWDASIYVLQRWWALYHFMFQGEFK